MKWVLLQMDIATHDVKANMATAERLISLRPDADVYIFPEMWATGFVTAPTQETVVAGETALCWMKQTAVKYHCCLGGSLAVSVEGLFYNRFYWVDEQGNVHFYDKRHLFAPGGEGESYQQGKERVIVKWRQVRILLQVCYDLRFPVFARNREDYDVMVCVASWPAVRAEVWNLLLRARAVENQCYVVGVNRVGRDSQLSYAGGSLVVDAKGRVLADGSDKESVVEIDMDMDELTAFRCKFPVLKDRDHFTLL